MNKRDRTIIARCDTTMESFLEEYADLNGLNSKSDAIRDIIGKAMDGHSTVRFAELGMHVPMDLATYEDVNNILERSGHDLKTVFYRGFSLWKEDLITQRKVTEQILIDLDKSADRVYGGLDMTEREGLAKKG